MRTPHALVRACRPTTTPRSRPSRLLSRLLARLPPGEPDETVHSPSTRLAVAPTTEPAAGRSTRTPWRTPRHASHYAAMTTQHSAHPPLPSAASLSLSISPLSFASTSLASFVPRLQWRAHKGCLGSDVSGTWWERTLTRTGIHSLHDVTRMDARRELPLHVERSARYHHRGIEKGGHRDSASAERRQGARGSSCFSTSLAVRSGLIVSQLIPPSVVRWT